MRMLSPTLFWYVFKDLVKVFMLANGALAGIFSFGGLLWPLTEQGLEAWQVGLLLSYFTPAMTAYSLPIAALSALILPAAAQAQEQGLDQQIATAFSASLRSGFRNAARFSAIASITFFGPSMMGCVVAPEPATGAPGAVLGAVVGVQFGSWNGVSM